MNTDEKYESVGVGSVSTAIRQRSTFQNGSRVLSCLSVKLAFCDEDLHGALVSLTRCLPVVPLGSVNISSMPPKIACTCRTHGCNGKRIPKAQAQEHRLEDARSNAPIQLYNAWAASMNAGPSHTQGSVNRYGVLRARSSSISDGEGSESDSRPTKRTKTSEDRSSESSSGSKSSSVHSSPRGSYSWIPGDSPTRNVSPMPDVEPAVTGAQLGPQAGPSTLEGQEGAATGQPEEGRAMSDSETDDSGISETENQPDPSGAVPTEVSGIKCIENSNQFIRSIRNATLDSDKRVVSTNGIIYGQQELCIGCAMS
ncbi:hypothetical protein FA13DRAFT_1920992 [Coprinellus micaceus]|uniref:Uncharacterized protein n=1 Tax=Coprinellus micaceus TaxID=71717 RepID=A0A4Y7SKH3_COPMI|nr:hypothetical protein FA13DRAFT_1920992 [Coprinellus micaceus]